MNFARFVDRFPHIEMMYGTTRNEAFHKQQTTSFRNVMIQTMRRARLICDMVLLVRLVAGMLKRHDYTTAQHDHELLGQAALLLLEGPLPFEPHLSVMTAPNPKVHLTSLRVCPQTIRKRPAMCDTKDPYV